MSTNNGTQPKNPFSRVEHWMISGEWEQIFEEQGSSIATAENPHPSAPRAFVRRMTASEVINCHPIAHAMKMTSALNPNARRNYLILYALPITKEQFEFVMGLQPGAPPPEVVQMAEDHFDKKEN